MSVEAGGMTGGVDSGGASSGADASSSGAPADSDSDSSSQLDGGSTTEESARRESPASPRKPVTPKKAAEPEFKFRDKFKYGGKEEEREFSRDELKRLAQLGLTQEDGFSRIKQEREAIKKERDELARIVRGAKSDPDSVLKLFGLDPDEYAAAKLQKHYELSQMTPEQREASELKQKLAQREAELDKHKKDTETRAAKEAEDRAWADVQPKLLKAADEFNLPREPWVMDMLAAVGDEFLEVPELADLDCREWVREVDKRLSEMSARHLKSVDVKTLKKILGPEKLKALIADNIAEARKSSFERIQGGSTTPDEPRVKPPPADDGIDEDGFMAALAGKDPRKRARR